MQRRFFLSPALSMLWAPVDAKTLQEFCKPHQFA